jgi:hypothetical protein
VNGAQTAGRTRWAAEVRKSGPAYGLDWMMRIANSCSWNLLFIDAVDLEEESVESLERFCVPFSLPEVQNSKTEETIAGVVDK